MKRVGKPVFFIIVLLIAAFGLMTYFGVSNTYGDRTTTYVKNLNQIRWGIDIRGGVDVTFSPPSGIDATNEQMASASEVMKQRLVSLNITDYEVYVDNNKDRIIVRFPWKDGEEDFDPAKAIAELGETALLTFREGYEVDSEGKPTGVTKDTVILEGKDVESAKAVFGPDTSGVNSWQVSLKLNSVGTAAFATATEKLAKLNGKGVVSIWMDDIAISYPTVNETIPNGEAVITGSFDQETATALANKIEAGALPFKLVTDTYSAITPTLGSGARDAMVLSGIIAFILIAAFVISLYRLPGVIGVIALCGQVVFMLSTMTGFFEGINSFTLTVPGIAGIILGIGMGVDANIITSERIKEEIRAGKSIDGSIHSGFARAFTAIFDGNVTVIIIALILMGAFGSPNSFLYTIFTPIFFMFPPSTQGAIYSFGFTLMLSVVLNFIFGVFCSRLMLKSISRFKIFRNPALYGGRK